MTCDKSSLSELPRYTDKPLTRVQWHQLRALRNQCSLFFCEFRERGASMECTVESPCVAIQLLAQRTNIHEERMEKMDDLIESVRNRPPLWMTFSLTASGGAIGLLVGLLTKG